MAAIETFKTWAETIRTDIEAIKAVVESAGADLPARKLAAGALSYLVSRLDLIPDWNAGIGFVDDVMVLRIAAQLIQNHDTGDLASTAAVGLGRMSNEADQISAFLGTSLFEKFRAHVARLVEQSVRGRSTGTIVDDEAARSMLWREIEEEITKAGPVVLGDPNDAEVRIKAYLTHKLGDRA